MELTEHQNNIMRELITGSTDKVKMLNGEAGCGKTVCISILVDKVIKKYGASNIAVVAFSSDAVSNLQKVLGNKITVSTAHQHFGYGGDNGYDNRRTGFYYRKPSVLIVDEVTTLPNYLLDEIYKEDIQAFLFGDKYQLEAVSNKPLLDNIYTVYLKEQMRQNTNTTLYRYITELRRSVIDKDDSIFTKGNDGSLELYTDEEEFNKVLISDNNSNLFVSFTHESQKKSISDFKSTIHKSQGQSVDTVYVDMRDLHLDFLDKDLMRRLLYVAVSRAKKKAVLLNYQ